VTKTLGQNCSLLGIKTECNFALKCLILHTKFPKCSGVIPLNPSCGRGRPAPALTPARPCTGGASRLLPLSAASVVYVMSRRGCAPQWCSPDLIATNISCPTSKLSSTTSWTWMTCDNAFLAFNTKRSRRPIYIQWVYRVKILQVNAV